MSDIYRVLKYDDNHEDENVWCEVSVSWMPAKSWVTAEELGGAFGAGSFLLIPAAGEYRRVEEHLVVTKQTYEFQADAEEVPA